MVSHHLGLRALLCSTWEAAFQVSIRSSRMTCVMPPEFLPLGTGRARRALCAREEDGNRQRERARGHARRSGYGQQVLLGGAPALTRAVHAIEHQAIKLN